MRYVQTFFHFGRVNFFLNWNSQVSITMKTSLFAIVVICFQIQFAFSQRFTMEQISSYPFPSELIAAPTNQAVAWAANEKGKRNIYLAHGPDFSAKKLTAFGDDDGQEISSHQFSPDGEWLVFVRGGEHGSNWDYNQGINPSQTLIFPKVQIWKIALPSGKPEIVGEGDEPVISPDAKTIAFIKNRQVWSVSLAGGDPTQLFEVKGSTHSLQWSPDGRDLAFVANRNSHSLIGVFRLGAEHIKWIAPSFSRDVSPRWSEDGSKIAFVRLPGGKGHAYPLLENRHNPWEIWVANVETGEGTRRWKSPETLKGSVPTTHGGFNLHWGADNDIVYLSYEDGWPHLYAMGADGGASRQLTKGNFMVEHIQLAPDGKSLLFSANTGNRADDIDRRHIGMVSIVDGSMNMLTAGEGIEAVPVVLSDLNSVAYLSADHQRPLMPTVLDLKTRSTKLVGAELLPGDFPRAALVKPKQVIFTSPDGLKVHGQIFEKEGGPAKKPAVLFVHGGPQRQMLLGWHYGDYYSNTYAINQYLAELGFVVLAVNFRLGIGYGYEFHKAPRTYWQGAEEYLDVKAAGEYLAGLEQVDSSRIGIYGGSYGGYLTALALGKDSDLFKVGVDIHGVHNLSTRLEMPDGYEKAPDYEKAVRTAWFSSPLAYLDTWKSPVLFIHGDDDRNVQVSQTTDLVRRFEEKKMPFEYLMVPDDSHHWMKFSNLVMVNQATADFLKKHLKP